MTDFHFLRPVWLLAIIPSVLILIGLWRNRTLRSSWQAVFDRKLLERLWIEPPGAISRLPLIILGLGWLLAILALAGPVWERQSEQVWRSKASRILVLDLSASMAATDQVPSRLERARFKIIDILKKSTEGRTGMVIFAGEPHIVSPLTEDNDTIANLLGGLSIDIVPSPGNSGAPALQMAIALLAQAGLNQGDILLFSDGLDDMAATLSTARDLHAKGYRLSVLALGTEQTVPIPRDSGGFSGMARLDVSAMQELARTGGGAFSLLTPDDQDLDKVLLESHLSTLMQESAQRGGETWIERGVWLLPLLLLLAAVGFRRGWLAGIWVILVIPPPVQAFEWRDLWKRPDQQAAIALEQGQPEVAARQFIDPLWRGMALYETGDYSGAAQAFAESDSVVANYNRGNALARAGQLPEAIAAYRKALKLEPEHADAKANLALVEKLLQQQSNPSSQHEAGNDQSQQLAQSGQDSVQPDQSDSGDQSATEKSKQDESAESGSLQHANQNQHENNPTQDPTTSPGAGHNEPDSMETARQDVTDQVQQSNEHHEQEMPLDLLSDEQPESFSAAKLITEAELALDQWLRQIPEDPSGLLRRKFMLEHLRRKQEKE